jgi:hypothetical protein
LQQSSVSSSILRNTAQTRNKHRNTDDNITERASHVTCKSKINHRNASKIIITSENKIKTFLEESSSKQQVCDVSLKWD